MDGATLQAKVYGGYAKAATRIGLPFDLHRPTSATTPLPTKLATIQASFNNENFNYEHPNKYGNSVWYGILDGTQTQVGDYLIGTSDPSTFFIAGMQPLLPILCVECNHTINIVRTTQQNAVGAIAYGGDTAANETPIMTGWPCSILIGGRARRNDLNLPGDVDSPGWVILIPAYPGTIIKNRDIITDENGQRYIVIANEQTDLGWRLQVTQALS
ncbi:MAG: hypothetical protein KGI54_18230 [Pseudomonadota bacterium]|nr:hypothetical protein [Pseudomonadota bacterium]